MENKPTRGSGFFEIFLSKERARIADSLIPENARDGRILDIGCGFYPYFLIRTRFEEKFGIDRLADGAYENRLKEHYVAVFNFDLMGDDRIPFESDFFNIVTMLAVIEHISFERGMAVLKEIRRVLKPGGKFILTTPAVWTKGLLSFLAKANLVSPDEINEHKYHYSINTLGQLFLKAGFEPGTFRARNFEFFMNIWASAEK